MILNRPEVGFDVQMLKAVQVMDIPVLKDFINALVMDSLTFGKHISSNLLHKLHERHTGTDIYHHTFRIVIEKTFLVLKII